MSKFFQMSVSECFDVVVSLDSSIADSKDVLRSDVFSNDVKKIVFRQAVDKKTLSLRLHSFLDSIAACKA